jgi:hypothetical protein
VRKEVGKGFAKTQEEIEELARMAADQFLKTATKEDLEQLQTVVLEAMDGLRGKSKIRSIV